MAGPTQVETWEGFALAVEMAMEDRAWSQGDLAAKSRVSRQTVNRALRTDQVSEAVAQAIAGALQMSLADLRQLSAKLLRTRQAMSQAAEEVGAAGREAESERGSTPSGAEAVREATDAAGVAGAEVDLSEHSAEWWDGRAHAMLDVGILALGIQEQTAALQRQVTDLQRQAAEWQAKAIQMQRELLANTTPTPRRPPADSMPPGARDVLEQYAPGVDAARQARKAREAEGKRQA